jgi:hypothetical protein
MWSLVVSVAFGGFDGQPACVELVAQEAGTVLLTNTCGEVVLLDQRVRPARATDRPVFGVAPGQSLELVAAPAFTLGVGGALYRVVAAQPPASASSTVASDTAQRSREAATAAAR